jgi:antitoxin CcdA
MHREDPTMRVKDERAGYAKRPANLSINAGLLEEARGLGINLSATLERALEAEVREKKRTQWLAEHREAIATYNECVARDGVFSAMFRKS